MGPLNFCQGTKVALVSRRKEMYLPDAVMAAWDSLLEMAVVGQMDPGHQWLSREKPRKLAWCPHVPSVIGTVDPPMSFLTETWTLFWWFAMIWTGQIQWPPSWICSKESSQAFGNQGVWVSVWVSWEALVIIRYFCLQAFSSFPWSTLKAIAKPSACGVRGSFSKV